MIILDFQQVVISNIMVHLGTKTINNSEIDEDLIRHMVLNSIRWINSKFRNDYGKLIIAYDSTSWRKQIFPYYKANRKKAHDKSPVDWVKLFDYFGRIKPELKEALPYKVIEVEGCEADDIIGTLVRFARTNEKVMIISGDKDFIQLHGENVSQYDPVQKKKIINGNPKDFLHDHILRGDPGDGIPNVLSDDDTFVSNKRQTPLTQKRIKEIMEHGLTSWYDAATNKNKTFRNFYRNKQLIDLTMTPEPLIIKVMEEYANFPYKNRHHLYQYLVQNRCKQLLESINDF